MALQKEAKVRITIDPTQAERQLEDMRRRVDEAQQTATRTTEEQKRQTEQQERTKQELRKQQQVRDATRVRIGVPEAIRRAGEFVEFATRLTRDLQIQRAFVQGIIASKEFADKLNKEITLITEPINNKVIDLISFKRSIEPAWQRLNDIIRLQLVAGQPPQSQQVLDFSRALFKIEQAKQTLELRKELVTSTNAAYTLGKMLQDKFKKGLNK